MLNILMNFFIINIYCFGNETQVSLSADWVGFLVFVVFFFLDPEICRATENMTYMSM